MEIYFSQFSLSTRVENRQKGRSTAMERERLERGIQIKTWNGLKQQVEAHTKVIVFFRWLKATRCGQVDKSHLGQEKLQMRKKASYCYTFLRLIHASRTAHRPFLGRKKTCRRILTKSNRKSVHISLSPLTSQQQIEKRCRKGRTKNISSRENVNFCDLCKCQQ